MGETVVLVPVATAVATVLGDAEGPGVVVKSGVGDVAVIEALGEAPGLGDALALGEGATLGEAALVTVRTALGDAAGVSVDPGLAVAPLVGVSPVPAVGVPVDVAVSVGDAPLAPVPGVLLGVVALDDDVAGVGTRAVAVSSAALTGVDARTVWTGGTAPPAPAPQAVAVMRPRTTAAPKPICLSDRRRHELHIGHSSIISVFWHARRPHPPTGRAEHQGASYRR